ncbi:hypothetical protein C8R45DRAFT_988997, partial [Mycena sanguinolenta]
MARRAYACRSACALCPIAASCFAAADRHGREEVAGGHGGRRDSRVGFRESRAQRRRVVYAGSGFGVGGESLRRARWNRPVPTRPAPRPVRRDSPIAGLFVLGEFFFFVLVFVAQWSGVVVVIVQSSRAGGRKSARLVPLSRRPHVRTPHSLCDFVRVGLALCPLCFWVSR